MIKNRFGVTQNLGYGSKFSRGLDRIYSFKPMLIKNTNQWFDVFNDERIDFIKDTKIKDFKKDFCNVFMKDDYPMYVTETYLAIKRLFDVRENLEDIRDFKCTKTIKIESGNSIGYCHFNAYDEKGFEMFYFLQAIYRSYVWHNRFASGEYKKWNMPMSAMFYNLGEGLGVHIHPGGTRFRFADFADTKSDMIVYSGNMVGRMDDYNYVDPEPELQKLFDSGIVARCKKTDWYRESMFFHNKVLNMDTMIYFGSMERRLNWIHNTTESNKYKSTHNFHDTIYTKISIDKGILWIGDEKIATIGDDELLRFETSIPQYSFKIDKT